MTALLAYGDPISLAPGERLRVMVSCIGANSYDALLVRLINPQAGPLATPFRPEPVEHPANRSYPGRRQRIPIGSFGIVDAHPLITGLESFTLQAYVWPTMPGRGRQALLGAWSESERRGFGLGLDERGALELRLGDGRQIASVSTASPLQSRRWYLVAGSFDAASGRLAVWQVPVGDRTFHDHAAVRAEATTAVRLGAAPEPFLFAAWHAGEAEAPTAYGRLLAGGHYNGKLDRPRLASRALEPDEVAALAGDGVLPAGLERALVGRWDLGRGISTETLVDTSPNRLHGTAVNLPARAMTGHNWTGAVMDWTGAPEQYGAIHFHDDDLVDANWQPDFELELPDGAALRRLRRAALGQRGRVLRAVLRAAAARPQPGPEPAQDRVPGVDRDLSRLHQQPGPLRLARDRALPRPADRHGCGRRPAARISGGRALDL